MEVVLDTSFIIACAQKKRDYLREIELTFGKVNFIVPSSVLRELEFLNSVEARVGKKIAEMHGFEIVDCEESADDCVIKIAEERGAFVASFDSKLRRRAREKGIRVITVRKGAYVMDSHY